MTEVSNPLNDHTALAWYDLKADTLGVSRFYVRAMQWMLAIGYPPDLLSVHGPGFTGKPAPFEPTQAKLHRRGFRGVSDITLFALSPGGEIPLGDCEAIASISIEDSFAFLVARAAVMSLRDSPTLRLAGDLVSTLGPQYGIGYVRDHQLGPAMYAIGIAQGLGTTDADDDEAIRVSSWSDAMEERVWRRGTLRDVYEWNFLNRAQLDMPIGRTSLEQWIVADSTRGTLERFTADLSLWRLAPERIDSVRSLLEESELLVDH